MKKGYKWLSGIVLAVTAMAVLPMTAHAAEKDMYCLYNSALKEYLYTIDENEKNNLLSTWEYKGVICTLPDSSSTPVYRLCDPVSAQHLYTSDDAEINKLVGEGWKKEGVAYYVDDAHTAPVYRMFNPATGEHQFSGSAAHMSSLEATGWVKEGVAYYALSVNESLTGAAVEPAIAYLNGKEVTADNFNSIFAQELSLATGNDYISSSSPTFNGRISTLYVDGAIYVTSCIKNKDSAECSAFYEVKQSNYYNDPTGKINMSWGGVELGATRDQVKAAWGEPTAEYASHMFYKKGTTCYLFEFNYRNPQLVGLVGVYFNCKDDFRMKFGGGAYLH